MAAQATASNTRRYWILGLRLVISVGLLVLLVSRIHLHNVLPKHPTHQTLLFFILGVLVTFLGIVLSAWRWQRALDLFDTVIPLRTLLSYYLASIFLGNLLPSTIGGDVLRISRVRKYTGSGAIAFASVVIERLSGFLALPLLCCIGYACYPSLLHKKYAWIGLATAGATLLILAIILTLAAHPRLAGRFQEHENWMRVVGAIHIGVNRLLKEPRKASAVLGAALIYQASTVLAVWCAAQALDVGVSFFAILAFAPAVAMAQVIPLSFSGLGVREGLLVVFLGALGVSAGRSIALGLMWYAMVLIVSLTGAPSFAINSQKEHENS